MFLRTLGSPTVYIHTYIVIETRVDNTNDLHNMPFNVVVRRLLRIDMASCGGDAEQRVHDDRGGFVQLHGLQEGTRDSARQQPSRSAMRTSKHFCSLSYPNEIRGSHATPWRYSHDTSQF